MKEKPAAPKIADAQSELGPRLRAIRLRQGVGLRELARRLDLSPSSISQIETGKIRPSVRTLYALASEFGVTVDEVLFNEMPLPGDGVSPSTHGSSPVVSGPALAVQRAVERPAITLNSGVKWERLMSWADEDVEFIEATYAPGRPRGRRLDHVPFGHTTSAQQRGHRDRASDLGRPWAARCGDGARTDRHDEHHIGSPQGQGGAACAHPGNAGSRQAQVMSAEGRTPGRALIVGATGISGGNLAQRLLADGWEVAGLCRRPQDIDERIRPLAADLKNAEAVSAAVRGTAPTHVFYTTWSRQATETENCDVNGRMIENLLAATAAERSVRHVALVTGLKHYLGPFEAYAKVQPDTPFSEDQPRLPYENAMNMGVTLAVYAAICRETGRGFHYPGSQEQWEAVTDVTDAGLLADHLVWAATTPSAANKALNIVNGDVFRWQRLWPRLAAALDVEAVPFNGESAPLEEQMADAGEIWPEIVRRHGLRDLDVDSLASWWHSDADLGRTVETFTDMGRSRRLGFLGIRDTESSFTELFARLRAERIVP